jgi:putative hydrolase
MPFPAGGNPFEHLLGDLLKVLGNAGQVQWEMARQLSLAVASDGEVEANPDPLQRQHDEELVRMVERHLLEATGLRVGLGPKGVNLRPLTRAQWAFTTLEEWRPVLAGIMEAGPSEPVTPPAGDDLGALLGTLGRTMGPALLGMQLGSAVGHLARRAFGRYDLPVPRAGTSDLAWVPRNISEFATAWGLDHDDVVVVVAITELTHQALFDRPHLRDRLSDLIGRYATTQKVDPADIERRLGGVDPGDLEGLLDAFSEHEGLVTDGETPEQAAIRTQIEALVAVVTGLADHLAASLGARLLGNVGRIAEALRRRQLDREPGERFLEQLFGIDLDRGTVERGSRFVVGVLERADEQWLTRLWSDPSALPTPAEVDAPGLWLERLRLGSA